MNRLFIRKGSEWEFFKNYPTYKEAVLTGQEEYAGNFYVDTGDRVPTREEQLLLTLRKQPNKTKRQEVLDSI